MHNLERLQSRSCISRMSTQTDGGPSASRRDADGTAADGAGGVWAMTAPTRHSFSLNIFVPDGDPAGLRLVKKPMWTGHGAIFPRAVFPAAKGRDVFAQAGIYVLLGPPEEGDLPLIYIGQGDPVRARLEQHYIGKDFWTWAIVFASSDGWLNSAHAQYLESRLVQRARETRRARLDNQNTPREPALAEAERADTEVFLGEMLSLLPVFGLTVFEPAPGAEATQITLVLQGPQVAAKGHDSAQGFVVTEGSRIRPTLAPSAGPGLTRLREELLTRGVLVAQGVALVFAQDYVFTSPSTAAGVVLGRQANGRTEWREASGRTLREIQEAESTPGPAASIQPEE
jgi:hypothetical protein